MREKHQRRTVAEGEPLGVAQTRIVSVPMVAAENKMAVPLMTPRDYKARRFHIRREVGARF